MAEGEPKTRFLAVEELRKHLDAAADDSETGHFMPSARGAAAKAPVSNSERTSTVLDALGAKGLRAQAARKSRASRAREPLAEPAPASIRLPPVPVASEPKQPSALERLLANRAIAVAGLVAAGVLALVVTAALSSPDQVAQAPMFGQAAVAPLVANAQLRTDGESAPEQTVKQTEPPSRAGRSPLVAAPVGTCEQKKERPHAHVSKPTAADDQSDGEDDVEPEPPAPISARLAVDLLLAGRRREALDAYRALSIEPGAPPELRAVATLLERELRTCALGDESCAP